MTGREIVERITQVTVERDAAVERCTRLIALAQSSYRRGYRAGYMAGRVRADARPDGGGRMGRPRLHEERS